MGLGHMDRINYIEVRHQRWRQFGPIRFSPLRAKGCGGVVIHIVHKLLWKKRRIKEVFVDYRGIVSLKLCSFTLYSEFYFDPSTKPFNIYVDVCHHLYERMVE